MQSSLSTAFRLLPWLSLLLLWGCQHPSQGPDRLPEAEAQSFQFADPDMRISLIAAEPDIESPVAMAWGPDGALFVVEMPGYPTTEATGQIKRLTDPDGDGRYHLASVFADGLNFPTSVMPYRGGVLVADAPDILWLQDKDGDGQAEGREVLLTGFKPGNQQLRVNALHWGMDNWIYGANGRSGGTLRFVNDSSQTDIDNRDIRFDPVKGQIEAISGMSQFGLAHDNWGNRFISYNHRFARQVVLEQKHLDRNPSLSLHAIFDTGKSEHDRRVYTLLKEAMRFNRDPIGYFTSLSGLSAYRGHLLGAGYQGDFFAGESAQAAVIRRRMQSDGVTYTANVGESDAEFLAATDDWFHPVNFANGPDGALYMVDFYRKFVEHPQWANEQLREGVDWNEGEHYGRIWRIAHKDAPWEAQRMQPMLDKASEAELVQQLADPAGWRRDMAQQLLVEGQSKTMIPALESLLKAPSPLARTHALWTLDGLAALNDTHLIQALQEEHPQVLVQAIKLSAQQPTMPATISQRLEILANSTDPMIRFQAILALGEVDGPAIRAALIQSANTYADEWTRIALLSSSAAWAGDFAKAMLTEAPQSSTANAEAVQFMVRVGEMVAHADKQPPTQDWITESSLARRQLSMTEFAFLSGYISTSAQGGSASLTLSPAFFDQALKWARDESNLAFAQIGIDMLIYAQSKQIQAQLSQLAWTSPTHEIQLAAIQALASQNDLDISNQLFARIQELDPLVRKGLIASSLRSHAAAMALLQAINQQIVDQGEIPEELRYALLSHTHAPLQQKAQAVLGSSVDADRQALVDRYLASLQNQPVNLAHGATLFTQNCSACHAINGSGGLLAPDLTNIGSRSDEVLLVSILDPSRMVSYELRLHIVETLSGEVFSGTLSAETLSSITIKQPGGEEQTILKANIRKRTVTDQSIMPEGFERMIDEKSMADLIGYLRQPNS